MDEYYTPYYAVDPLLKYIPQSVETIWCPFDKEWSAFVQTFKSKRYKVISTHIDNGYDFFTYEPPIYDVIISNPPFSQKDKIFKRLRELHKPFALLMPFNTLQNKALHKYFKFDIQLLGFDARIDFHDPDNMIKTKKGIPFPCAYFCKDFLPKDLILEHLEKYEKNINYII